MYAPHGDITRCRPKHEEARWNTNYCFELMEEDVELNIATKAQVATNLKKRLEVVEREKLQSNGGPKEDCSQSQPAAKGRGQRQQRREGKQGETGGIKKQERLAKKTRVFDKWESKARSPGNKLDILIFWGKTRVNYKLLSHEKQTRSRA